jgi:HPt (histidine-containing phosphotransfer) domain-containing protein
MSRQPTPTLPPVNLSQFQALAGGEAAMRNLAGFYIPYVAERLDTIRSAVNAGAADQVEIIARQLAGANAAAGVTDIVGPLVTLEQLAREGRLAMAAIVLAEAETVFARISDFLLQYVEAVRPGPRPRSV